MAHNRKTHDDFFLEVSSKKGLHDLCGRKFVGKVAQKLFGQIWRNLGKNPSHPQSLPAPTPMSPRKNLVGRNRNVHLKNAPMDQQWRT